MDEILEDIKKSAWNFITLIISVFLFFTLKSTADSFVSQYGAKVKVKSLFVDDYLSGTLSILGLIFITLVLLCATFFLIFDIKGRFFTYVDFSNINFYWFYHCNIIFKLCTIYWYFDYANNNHYIHLLHN